MGGGCSSRCPVARIGKREANSFPLHSLTISLPPSPHYTPRTHRVPRFPPPRQRRRLGRCRRRRWRFPATHQLLCRRLHHPPHRHDRQPHQYLQTLFHRPWLRLQLRPLHQSAHLLHHHLHPRLLRHRSPSHEHDEQILPHAYLPRVSDGGCAGGGQEMPLLLLHPHSFEEGEGGG